MTDNRSTGQLVSAAIRAHCTPSVDAYAAGGDALIAAVADWIENPPDWVDAPWLASRPSSPQATDRCPSCDSPQPALHNLDGTYRCPDAYHRPNEVADERGKLIAEAQEYADVLQGGESENWLRLVDLTARLVAALESDGQEEK